MNDQCHTSLYISNSLSINVCKDGFSTFIQFKQSIENHSLDCVKLNYIEYHQLVNFIFFLFCCRENGENPSLMLGKLGENSLRSVSLNVYNDEVYIHINDFSKKKSVSMNLDEYKYFSSFYSCITEWGNYQKSLCESNTQRNFPFQSVSLTPQMGLSMQFPTSSAQLQSTVYQPNQPPPPAPPAVQQLQPPPAVQQFRPSPAVQQLQPSASQPSYQVPALSQPARFQPY